MNHAKRLDKEAAERFVQRSGSISLGGFSVLDEAAVEALAHFDGSLRLHGLTALSDTADHDLHLQERDCTRHRPGARP
jgi:hypothetical protein